MSNPLYALCLEKTASLRKYLQLFALRRAHCSRCEGSRCADPRGYLLFQQVAVADCFPHFSACEGSQGHVISTPRVLARLCFLCSLSKLGSLTLASLAGALVCLFSRQMEIVEESPVFPFCCLFSSQGCV